MTVLNSDTQTALMLYHKRQLLQLMAKGDLANQHERTVWTIYSYIATQLSLFSIASHSIYYITKK